MKVLLFVILSFVTFTDPGKISRINTLKSEARKAFNAGDYQTAVSKYQMLKDSLLVNEDEIKLNLAHAYYQLKDSAQAISTYQEATASLDKSIRSKANQQLGIIHNQQGKFEEALNNFKQAIKADPNNMDARYNYEMLKKKLEEKKKQEEQQKQKDQPKNKEDQKKEDEKKDEQNKKDKEKNEQNKKEDQKKSENKDEQSKEEKKDEKQKKDEQQKDSEKPSEDKKETPPSVSEKLQQMKISEEKAKMLLEAMKNQEVQYLQQNKRKATKPKEKGKPDW